jgi:DNA-binding XRE family transcriptional regulator
MSLTVYRKRVGWSQSDLAKHSQQAVSTIADLEARRNRNPSFRLCIAVCQALNRAGLDVRPEQLFASSLPRRRRAARRPRAGVSLGQK